MKGEQFCHGSYLPRIQRLARRKAYRPTLQLHCNAKQQAEYLKTDTYADVPSKRANSISMWFSMELFS